MGATLIDFLVFIPVYALTYLNIINYKIFALQIFFTLCWVVYKPLMEWRYSATLGKKAMGIRVVNEDLKPISLQQSIWRFSLYFINSILGLAANYYLFSSAQFADLTNFWDFTQFKQQNGTIISQIGTGFSFIIFISIVFVIFDQRKQSLHDKIAKTFCIVK